MYYFWEDSCQDKYVEPFELNFVFKNRIIILTMMFGLLEKIEWFFFNFWITLRKGCDASQDPSPIFAYNIRIKIFTYYSFG